MAKAFCLHGVLIPSMCCEMELTKANVRLWITSSLQWGKNVLLMEPWRGMSTFG